MTRLASNAKEDWYHMAHMVNGEDGVEQLSLLAMMIAYQQSQRAYLRHNADVPKVARSPGPNVRRFALTKCR